jgi:AmmeMemoRadiSam system protein A
MSGCLPDNQSTTWEIEKIRALVKALLAWFVKHPGTYKPEDFPQELQQQIKNTLTGDYFNQSGGLFFTLKKNGGLRGCMGTLSSTSPYKDSILRQIHMAAFEDPRFPQVSEEELGDLCGEFTFLGPLRDAQNWEDWNLGTHGIQITLDFHRAVFLPTVPLEQNWDKTTTLRQLCRKGRPGGK